MSKSILIIDTPSVCVDCLCHFADDEMVWCGKEERELLSDDIESYKPNWCPLKEIPKKLAEENRWFSKDYAVGYNACIDEILEEPDKNETD